MNLQKFRNTDTDLGRFYNYLDNINKSLIIEEEDWDNMGGITVSHLGHKGTLYNFYDDGSFRTMDNCDRNFDMKVALSNIEKDISYMSFWDMFKYWRKIKNNKNV